MEEENKDQKLYTIYKITCSVNGKMYIGATSQTAEKRFGEHWRHRCSPKMEYLPLCQDMNSFGKKAFMVETLEDSIIPSEARNRENYWIKYHESNGYDLYNQRAGGGGKIEITDEQKQLIIESYSAGKSMAEISKEMGVSSFSVSQVVQQCGIAKRNKRNKHNKVPSTSRRVFCIETETIYESVSEAARRLGLYASSISACCHGKQKSAGSLHFCFPKDKDSYVIQEPKAQPTSRKVLCIESGIIYESAHEAARQLGLDRANISKCCSGKYKSTGGLRFCFPEDKDSYVIQEPKEAPRSKRVLCIESGTIYDSVSKAAMQLGLFQSSISRCCLGEYKSTGGFHFEYAD